jgi:hypothetical protein
VSLVDGLLVRTATITRRTQTGPPVSANLPSWVPAVTSGVPCYIEQLSGQEFTLGRETSEATHLGVFPAGAVLGATDRVESDGTTYEVVGPVSAAHDPFDGTDVVDHVEATLKELSGE